MPEEIQYKEKGHRCPSIGSRPSHAPLGLGRSAHANRLGNLSGHLRNTANSYAASTRMLKCPQPS